MQPAEFLKNSYKGKQSQTKDYGINAFLHWSHYESLFVPEALLGSLLCINKKLHRTVGLFKPLYLMVLIHFSHTLGILCLHPFL